VFTSPPETLRPNGLSRTALLRHLRLSAPNFTNKSPGGWTHRAVEAGGRVNTHRVNVGSCMPCSLNPRSSPVSRSP